jgi:hypothetical protein
MEGTGAKAARADRSRRKLVGSGMVVAVVIIASSNTKDVPAGSPVIVTLEMPLGKRTCKSSFGLLLGSPRQIGPGSHPTLIEKAEVAEAIWVLAASNASNVRGS